MSAALVAQAKRLAMNRASRTALAVVSTKVIFIRLEIGADKYGEIAA